MIIRNLLIVLCIVPQFVFAQKATVTEFTKEFVTYPFGDPNPIPVLTESKFKIYLFHSFHGYALVPEKTKLESGQT